MTERGIHVVYVSDGGKRPLNDSNDEFDVLFWPSRRPTGIRDGIFLAKLLRHYRPQCTIANFASTNVMSLVGAIMDVPVRIAWHHTVSEAILADSHLPWYTNRLLQLRKRIAHRFATHIVANSKAAAQDAELVFSLPRGKARSFPNSLVDPVETHGISAMRFPSVPRIVCVGRFSPSKGQDVVIRAAPQVLESFPNAQFHFAGAGETEKQCIELTSSLGIKGSCFFHGKRPQSEIIELMSSATAVVVPSRNEAFGLVNIEAMAVGVPVVASDIGGIPELIRNGEEGLLFPVDDVNALTRSLLRLLQEPGTVERMSANARRRFLSTYEQRVVVTSQSAWIESLLDPNHDTVGA